MIGSGVLLLALLAGCASKQPILTDGGPNPAADPYDHLQNPQYTTGAVAGFRTLFVDPETYPASLEPDTPPPAPPIQSTGASLPEGLLPGILISADLTKLNENLSFDTLTKSIAEKREGVVVQMPSEGLILFPADSDAGRHARALRRLNNTRIADQPLNSVATISVVETLPEPLGEGMVQEQPEGTESFLVTVLPLPEPPKVPTSGTLFLKNTSTASAEVSINNAKMGVIGPLGHGSVLDVKAGTYKISFLLPNGYSWTEESTTVPVEK